jgi:hypothetical protein
MQNKISKAIHGELSEYEQAELSLNEAGVTFKAEFLKHGKHFEDDKDERDIYKITLEREGRSYSFNFGQSLQNSGKWMAYRHIKGYERIYQSSKNISLFNEEVLKTVSELNKTSRKPNRLLTRESNIGKNPDFKAPDCYDVLACLTKYDPGTFEDFCGDFGYDEDSRTAEKTYKAVKNEFLNLERLFTPAQMEKLQEIQ